MAPLSQGRFANEFEGLTKMEASFFMFRSQNLTNTIKKVHPSMFEIPCKPTPLNFSCLLLYGTRTRE